MVLIVFSSSTSFRGHARCISVSFFFFFSTECHKNAIGTERGKTRRIIVRRLSVHARNVNRLSDTPPNFTGRAIEVGNTKQNTSLLSKLRIAAKIDPKKRIRRGRASTSLKRANLQIGRAQMARVCS